MNGHYAPGEIVLGKWQLEKLLGTGSFGSVYEATRNDFGAYKAAIKIITIPQNSAEILEARSEGLDDAGISHYFRSIAEDMVREFELMSHFTGHSNIVSYEDHDVIPHADGFGCDIMIRMELLQPLMRYMHAHPMNTQDVIRLGVDICKALEFCQRYNVIHRDIKPENIFVSKMGDFKLGDFGIARTAEKSTRGMSQKGTYTYMAPEVFRGANYDSTVDIYSLGIVLYRLLNHNRAPFLPLPPSVINVADREAALSRRICGDPMPMPANAGPQLARVILKACAFNPADRYQSAAQMRADLEALMVVPDSVMAAPAKVVAEDDANDRTAGIWRTAAVTKPEVTPVMPKVTAPKVPAPEKVKVSEPAASIPVKEDKKPKKKNLLPVVIIGIVAIIAVLAVLLLSGGGKSQNMSVNNDKHGISANEENDKITEEDLPDSGDLFASMLWGSYDAMGIYVPVEGEEGQYDEDLTEFLKKAKYTNFGDKEVTILPVSFSGYSRRFGSDFYADELIHYSDPDDMELLKEVIVAEYGTEYWVNFNAYLDLNQIEVEASDRNGYTYSGNFAYRLEGNKVILSTIEILDESTFAFTLTDIASAKMAVDGQNIILSSNGWKVTYQIAELSGRFGDSTNDIYVTGYVFDDALAYRDIAYIGIRGDYDTNPDEASTYVEFTDGFFAIDPTHTFNEDGTLTIRWEKRWSEYNGYTEEVDDPVEFTCEYMAGIDWWNESGGLLLKIDGKWYRYQNTAEAYYGKKLQGIDTESLSDEQVQNIIFTKDNLLDDLSNAFTDAGISATIDPTTGKVNMDASFLFATSDYSLSDAGKAYLDGFLDVYTAVVLSDSYAGYVSEIVIEGHTDTQGQYDYNMELSENRAASVADYCIQRNPELENIISRKGYSYDYPVYNEDGSVNMDASRRVTFRVVLTPVE